MGYTTDFDGTVTVTPPLNEHEVTYLRMFAETRRMKRGNGPYFVEGTGAFGQGKDADVQDYNRPPDGQPGLWCQWTPTDAGSAIGWDGEEKFYSSAEWMTYLIDTFLRPGAAVQRELAAPVPGRVYPDVFAEFTFDHSVSGVINAQGGDPDDMWRLCVTENTVTVQRPTVVWPED